MNRVDKSPSSMLSVLLMATTFMSSATARTLEEAQTQIGTFGNHPAEAYVENYLPDVLSVATGGRDQVRTLEIVNYEIMEWKGNEYLHVSWLVSGAHIDEGLTGEIYLDETSSPVPIEHFEEPAFDWIIAPDLARMLDPESPQRHKVVLMLRSTLRGKLIQNDEETIVSNNEADEADARIKILNSGILEGEVHKKNRKYLLNGSSIMPLELNSTEIQKIASIEGVRFIVTNRKIILIDPFTMGSPKHP